MHIHEVILEAKKEQKAIQRKTWRENRMGLIPTNSSGLGMFIFSENGKRGSRNWNPTAEDLTADDWELF